MATNNQKLVFPIILCLTLGLAPFIPEPHFFGKIRWVMGGAVGMQPLDYLDLLFHGLPWIYLTVVLVQKTVKK